MTKILKSGKRLDGRDIFKNRDIKIYFNDNKN